MHRTIPWHESEGCQRPVWFLQMANDSKSQLLLSVKLVWSSRGHTPVTCKVYNGCAFMLVRLRNRDIKECRSCVTFLWLLKNIVSLQTVFDKVSISLSLHLSLSFSYTQTSTPTESCHTQQKPPKLNLTRSRPVHQPTTHTIGIIDQSFTFWWKQGKGKCSRVFFFVFSADISRQLYVFLSIAVPVSSLSLWHII